MVEDGVLRAMMGRIRRWIWGLRWHRPLNDAREVARIRRGWRR